MGTWKAEVREENELWKRELAREKGFCLGHNEPERSVLYPSLDVSNTAKRKTESSPSLLLFFCFGFCHHTVYSKASRIT